MNEFIPLSAGLVIGLLALWIPPGRARWTFIVAMGLATGVLVAAALGELGKSWGFAVFDAAQAVAAAGAAVLAVQARRLKRRE